MKKGMTVMKRIALAWGFGVWIVLLMIIFVMMMRGSQKFQKDVYTLDGAFTSIEVETDRSTVCFLPSEDGACTVVDYRQDNVTHTAEIQNGVLRITFKDERVWYQTWPTFRKPKLTVYLPDSIYETLVVRTTKGKVDIPEDFIFNDVTVYTTSGDVSCRAVVLGILDVQTTKGKVDLG